MLKVETRYLIPQDEDFAKKFVEELDEVQENNTTLIAVSNECYRHLIKLCADNGMSYEYAGKISHSHISSWKHEQSYLYFTPMNAVFLLPWHILVGYKNEKCETKNYFGVEKTEKVILFDIA